VADIATACRLQRCSRIARLGPDRDGPLTRWPCRMRLCTAYKIRLSRAVRTRKYYHAKKPRRPPLKSPCIRSFEKGLSFQSIMLASHKLNSTQIGFLAIPHPEGQVLCSIIDGVVLVTHTSVQSKRCNLRHLFFPRRPASAAGPCCADAPCATRGTSFSSTTVDRLWI